MCVIRCIQGTCMGKINAEIKDCYGISVDDLIFQRKETMAALLVYSSK